VLQRGPASPAREATPGENIGGEKDQDRHKRSSTSKRARVRGKRPSGTTGPFTRFGTEKVKRTKMRRYSGGFVCEGQRKTNGLNALWNVRGSRDEELNLETEEKTREEYNGRRGAVKKGFRPEKEGRGVRHDMKIKKYKKSKSSKKQRRSTRRARAHAQKESEFGRPQRGRQMTEKRRKKKKSGCSFNKK